VLGDEEQVCRRSLGGTARRLVVEALDDSSLTGGLLLRELYSSRQLPGFTRISSENKEMT
jgi:hypothetical protein